MDLLRDIRFGLRTLGRSPWFASVAVLTLALGIGANTALFSVVDAVLLRSTGYADPATLVQISGTNRQGQAVGVSIPDMQAFRTRAHGIEKIGASRVQTFTIMGAHEPENVYGQLLSEECFAALGATQLLGRTFAPADFQSGAPAVAVIAHRLWQSAFQGDPQIVGRRILLNGSEYSIVGVMRPEFWFPHPVFQIWTPWALTAEDQANRNLHAYTLLARIKTGTPIAALDAGLKTLSQSLAGEFPATNTGWKAVVEPVNERLYGNLRSILFVLLGAVAFVLLIACLNVSNLVMARGIERAREMAVRAALGASRIRLAVQLLTESLLIGGMGCLLGLLFAHWWLKGLLAMLPSRTIPILPNAERAEIDGRVLAIALCASLVTGIVFGLLPAIRLSRANLDDCLKEGGRSNSGGRGRRRWLTGLVLVETALSVILLAGAGVMLRSLAHHLNVQLGFRPEHVLTVQVPSAWDDLSRRPNPADAERKMQYFHDLVEHVQSLPGVNAAGITTVLPLTPVAIQTRFYLPGGTEDNRVPVRSVSPDYFRAMGIPLLRGRVFTDADRRGQAPVVIVSEAMSRRYWPNQDAVGRQLTLGNPQTGAWSSVVGVVASVRHDRLTVDPEPELYTSYVQSLLGPQVSVIVIRTTVDPLTLAPAVRSAIRAVNPNQPIAELKTMSRVVSEAVSQPRLYTTLLAIFAGLALFLAAAGIFSVISWTVSQNTHEIGIRMALGATPRDVLRATMRRAMIGTAAGAVLGLAGAAGLTGLLKSQLFGVAPADPVAFAAAPALLLAIATLAAYLPARRATRIDPMQSLRQE